LEQRQLALHKELTRQLYKYFRDNSLFSKNDRTILAEVISLQLHNILQLEQTEPDDEFKEIFNAVEKTDYDEAAEEELNGLKREMKSLFAEGGADFDMDEPYRKYERAPRKTKKQLEKEAKEKQLEEARARSINSIYKRLVKIFHPDLELDPERRLQKDELMKKLTTSYKSGDLHTLLHLELQWIQQEGSNIDKLTDDKLSLYNESLKQQIDDLEEEINKLLHHPRYQPLYQFAGIPNQLPFISLKDIKDQKNSLIGELMRSLSALQSDQARALAEIQAVIYAFKSYRS
jgi:hypothetical protein